MQWELETVDGVGVLRLSGFLGARATHRFRGAFDWAMARCPGPIVVDLSDLRGWSTEGEAAIVDAAGLLGERGPLAVCGVGRRKADLLRSGSALSVLRLCADLDVALVVLGVH
ncbi:STAS domain-containing protein [Streptomyces sp. NRRL B-24484]|uniref:STAS domain-containing protein n=1 Tax=Streptomyces sp. NRRL B-24484 TaxID=1463833 RepID=UPI0005BD2EFE|nr:STAS domain-containing protein [Streptomyces sp. NRRL B-24484]